MISSSAGKRKAREEAERKEEEEWEVGGSLYKLKRRREKIAKFALQQHKRQEDDDKETSEEGRLKRIEDLIETLMVMSEDQEREVRYLKETVVEGNEEDRKRDEMLLQRRASLARGAARVGA